MGRSLGISDSTADIDGGKALGLSSLSTAAASTVGFYGTTPGAQRASAVQVAVSTSTVAVATGAQFGFSTTAQGNGLIATVNEVVATLTALGLWKGGA